MRLANLANFRHHYAAALSESICASVAFPAWVLSRDPTQKIVQ
jgi:hypothetical protein